MLKSNILKQLPDYRIVLSKPIIRHDHEKANLAVRDIKVTLLGLRQFLAFEKLLKNVFYFKLKETRKSYFCESPKNHRLMFAS